MKALAATVPAGFWWGVLGGLLSGVVVLLVQHALERRAERERREPGLAVRLVTKDVFASVTITGRGTITVKGYAVHSDRPPAAVPAEPPPSARPAPPPQEALPSRDTASDDHDVLHLLVRNLSERPAAIVDVSFTGADGKELAFDVREYRSRLAVPLVLPGWGAQALRLRLDFREVRDAHELVLVDMDEKKIRLPLRDPKAWQRWVTYE